MEILMVCAGEMWAGEKYLETKCWVKKQFLWKPMDRQHVHVGFHLLGQITETDFLYPLSIQDTYAMIGAIWLKFSFFVKWDKVNSHFSTDGTM